MEKFTKMKDKKQIIEEDLIFNGKNIDIIKYKDSEIIKSKDKVAILPYFRDESTFLMLLEYLPTYQYKNKESKYRNITNYLTTITGTIEENETVEQTIRRELYEEGGIVLNNLYNFEYDGPFFLTKNNTTQIWTCLVELPVNSYKQIKPPTDGSKKEKLSSIINVSIGDINQIIHNDLVTKYLIDKLINRIANL